MTEPCQEKQATLRTWEKSGDCAGKSELMQYSEADTAETQLNWIEQQGRQQQSGNKGPQGPFCCGA